MERKKTPMQMRKETTKAPAKMKTGGKAGMKAGMKEARPEPKAKVDKAGGKRPMSAMERYAQERQAKMKAGSVPALIIEQHDPHSDMHALTRAAEIRKNPARHRAAKMVAKQRMKDLADVAEA